MTLVKWNPRTSLMSGFDRMIENFFNENWNIINHPLTDWVPAVDIEETEKEYILKADVPGMSKKDVKVNVRDGVLSISGERKMEKKTNKDTYHYQERQYGSFNRTFRLPETIDEDKISAKFNDGILTVTMPKSAEVLPKEREIKIS